MAATSAKKRSATKESPNWTEMPDELMTNILQRLGSKEILKSSRKVCTTWRRICKDPAMWKVIAMHRSFVGGDEWNEDYILEKITKKAVDLSCGELIDISIKDFGTDALLHHIVLRSSKLKCLRLLSCSNITGNGLIQAVKRLPQLEKLELFNTHIKGEEIELIGQNCPHLKTFIVTKWASGKFINCDDYALAIANSMPELRHLKVADWEMTNDGLKAILNGCPHLQSLDVRSCRNLWLDGKLGKLCMDRVKDFKRNLIQKYSSFKLKYLVLISCNSITGHGLIRAVERVPQLEVLHLCNFYVNAQEIEVFGRNCPQLQSFKVNLEFIGTSSNCDENAFAIANNMPQLRSLLLFDTNMTKNGLLAILNCCLHLESLHILMSYDLDLDEDLRKLCVEQIKDFHFSLYYDYDDYPISSRDVDLEPYDDD